MIIAGIIDQDEKMGTINLINSLFSPAGKKVSMIDSGSLTQLDFFRIKCYLNELERNNTDILILKINLLDVYKEVFGFLHFDVMVFADKADDLKEIFNDNFSELMPKVFSLMDEKGIIIVNADDSEIIQFLHGLKYYTITYGFNSKASITTSSIGDDVYKENFMCCLQRTISVKDGLLIEPQEYRIKITSNDFDSYSVLAAATFAIVNGVDLNAVN
jgi:UDP-N-acetylmuramyl tripeptide synthase